MMTTTSHRWTKLQGAMATLTAACDWAEQRDGTGFSSADAPLGHYLGESDPADWDLAAAATAAAFATKYKRQLGINGYTDLLDEPARDELAEYTIGDAEDRETIRQRASDKRSADRAAAKLAASTITIDGGLILLDTPYDPALVEAQRAIPGRRWNGSTNTFPLSSLPEVIAVANTFGIPVSDDLIAQAADIAAAPVQAPPAVTLAADGDLIIDTPYNPSLLSALREINGRSTWVSSKSVHRINPAKGASELLTLFTDLGLVLDDPAAALLGSLAEAAAAAEQVILTGDQLEFRKVTDPNVIDALNKAVGGTVRRSRSRIANVPINHSPDKVLALLDDFALTVSTDAHAALVDEAARQERNRAASVAAAGEPFQIDGLGITPMPHQYAGIRFAVEHKRTIVADEMGLGKTYTALAALSAAAAFPAVVACKPDLIGNWSKEIAACLPGKAVHVAEGMTASPIPPGTDIVLIGFSALGARLKNPRIKTTNLTATNTDDVTKVADKVSAKVAGTAADDRVVTIVEASAAKDWATALTDALPNLTVSTNYLATDVDVIVTDKDRATARDANIRKTLVWADALNDFSPHGFIIDEGHFGKEATAARSQAMAQVGSAVAARDGMVLDLTGTPLVNRPRELAQQLVTLGYLAPQDTPRGQGEHYLFGEFGGFLFRYCGPKQQGEYGWTFNGASHLSELNERLHSWGLYLRRRQDVLHDLPDFQMRELIIDPADLDPELWEHYQAAEADTIRDLITAAEKYAKALGVPVTDPAVKKAMSTETADHLPKINKLRQIIGTAKTPFIEKWIADKIADGEKVMVAAHHRPVVTRYAKQFGGLRIQGEQTVASKEADKARFQTASVQDAPVISVPIGAGGVGHTLTAARIGIQAEHCWTPGEVNQMAKRIHRIGQTRDVEYYVAVVPGSIDERMWEMIGNKQGVVSAVLDGEESTADQSSTDTATSAASDVIWDYVTA